MPSPTFTALQEAARRIRAAIHRTPVITCATLDGVSGHSLFFKCEQLQKVGAFKFRGALNAVLSLDEKSASRGVITHSSGNHAQALALAAKVRGIRAHVVMPDNASAVKKRAVADYGAQISFCEPTLLAREETTNALIAETGATFVHPYDDARIIAGQGTAALELVSDVPALDAIVVPVGGGGLLAGSCIAACQRPGRSPLMIAAEPAGADDAARSLAADRFIPQESPNTLCDGLLTSLGELTWPIIRAHVRAVITVKDEATVRAMRLLWERTKLLVETNAAVALAAVLTPRFDEVLAEALGEPKKPRRVGVILSGGNVDLDALPW